MLMTLWVIFPSPLMVGGELPAADAWTLSLLTNPEVLAVDQHSSGNHPVIHTKNTVVWLAQGGSGQAQYLAVFNLTKSKAVLRYGWKELDLAGPAYELRDLWEHKDLGSTEALRATLPPHGCVLYRLTPVRDAGR
jgi:hypothetical protein